MTPRAGLIGKKPIPGMTTTSQEHYQWWRLKGLNKGYFWVGDKARVRAIYTPTSPIIDEVINLTRGDHFGVWRRFKKGAEVDKLVTTHVRQLRGYDPKPVFQEAA